MTHKVTYTASATTPPGGITPTNFPFGTTFSAISVGLWAFGAPPTDAPVYGPVLAASDPFTAVFPTVEDTTYTLIAQAMDNSTPPVPLGAPYVVEVIVSDPPVSIPIPTGGLITVI